VKSFFRALSRRKIIAGVFLSFVIVNAGPKEIIAGRQRPFMLFVKDIIPPPGISNTEDFNNRCFLSIKNYFDSTTYQAIRVGETTNIEVMSNNKRDLILFSDPYDYHLSGRRNMDTLVVWMRFKVGFTHARISIPYNRHNTNNIPEWIARKALASAKSDFLSTLKIVGGPKGMTVWVDDLFKVVVPTEVCLPSGSYNLYGQHPACKNRKVAFNFPPGKYITKRILLLPKE
jgi:hypothetical protein